MESMVNGGWVKLYRELKSKSIWQLSSPEQKVVLITILLLANHEENKHDLLFWRRKLPYGFHLAFPPDCCNR